MTELNFGKLLDVTKESSGRAKMDFNVAALSSQFTYDDTNRTIDINPHKNTTTAHATAVPLSITHGNWADALSNEEIYRLNVPAGSVLEVHALDLELKGGGSLATPSNLTVDVYDVTAATVLASTDADATPTTGSPIGSSGDGNTVIVRISNSSGSAQGASIAGSLYFV